MKLMDNILWPMENKKVVALVAMDLSAVFDTVDHEILLDILQQCFGITDKALSWFHEYLRPKSFKVCVNGKYSPKIDINYSVPQGSCAGGEIFNSYCSPLGDIMQDSLNLNGYADDHALNHPFNPNDRNDKKDTVQQMEMCMTNVKTWIYEVRLKLNSSKTEFVYFANKTQISKCTSTRITVNKKFTVGMINFLRIRVICRLLTTET